MESVKLGLKSLVNDPIRSSERASFTDFSSDQGHILVRRGSSQMVSVWTCTKLCALGFIVGVFVGFTLKRRVRRWASKLLRRLKDD